MLESWEEWLAFRYGAKVKESKLQRLDFGELGNEFGEQVRAVALCRLGSEFGKQHVFGIQQYGEGLDEHHVRFYVRLASTVVLVTDSDIGEQTPDDLPAEVRPQLQHAEHVRERVRAFFTKHRAVEGFAFAPTRFDKIVD